MYYYLAGSGSRSFDPKVHLSAVEASTDLVRERLYEYGSELILVTGMAKGWDRWIADLAIDHSIPYVACVPSLGYGQYYWKDEYDAYERYLRLAKEVRYTSLKGLYIGGVHVNFLRNQEMVDLADEFIVFDAGSSGTRDCVRRIRQKGVPYSVYTA